MVDDRESQQIRAEGRFLRRVRNYEAVRYDKGERLCMNDLIKEDAFEAFDVGESPDCNPYNPDRPVGKRWLRHYHEREMDGG